MYQIIVRFPNKKIADKWIGQMTDGIGEGLCDFNPWIQKPGTSGKKDSDFKQMTGSAPEGTPVFEVNEIFEF